MGDVVRKRSLYKWDLLLPVGSEPSKQNRIIKHEIENFNNNFQQSTNVKATVSGSF